MCSAWTPQSDELVDSHLKVGDVVEVKWTKAEGNYTSLLPRPETRPGKQGDKCRIFKCVFSTQLFELVPNI